MESIPKMMKAVFQEEKGCTREVKAVLRKVPTAGIDNLPNGMMLVRTVATSICGSDLWGKGCGWREHLDYIDSKKGCVGGGGHEVIARVVKVNPPCKYNLGDLVLCMTTNYLQGVDSVATQFEEETGYRVKDLPPQGSFSEFFVTYEGVTLPVPVEGPCRGFDRRLYLTAQPLGTIIHALQKVPSPAGKIVVVIGQGQNGLMMTAMLSGMGVRKLIVVDKYTHRLEMAVKLGAEKCYLASGRRDVGEEILHNEGPVELVFEMVGHQAASLHTASTIASSNGTILVFGLPPSATTPQLTIPFHAFARNVQYTTTHAPPMSTFAAALSLIQTGRFDPTPLYTHKFDFSDFPTAYDTASMYRDKVVKTLVTFDGKAGL